MPFKKGGRWKTKKGNMDSRSVGAKKMQLGNPNFDTYYKAQEIVGEHEWDAFSATMLTPLPTAFRMNQHSPLTPLLVKDLKERFPEMFAAADAALQVAREAQAAGAKAAAEAGAAAASAAAEGDKEAAEAAVLETVGDSAARPDAGTYLHNTASAVRVLEGGQMRLKRTLPAKVDAPTMLSWVPSEAGWNVTLARQDLRRIKELKPFHEWLKLFTETGVVLRQEAVSMIPPLLLDVQPHHFVLDMCAAPGSKTAQLLEGLHAEHAKGGPCPTGLVVANDTNAQRAYMMSHRLAPQYSAALAVTCNDGRTIPNVMVARGGVGSLTPLVEPFLAPGGSTPEANAVQAITAVLETAKAKADALTAAIDAGAPRPPRTPASERLHDGMFDRILCDAPCSGDGTLRKTAESWKGWSARNGIVLAPLQLAIARRGVSLLKVGGMMVYSTCTFNPIEDEVIVAQLLRDFKGGLELVDTTSSLPGLKRRPGKSTWTVYDSDMNLWTSHAAAQTAGALATRVRDARVALKSAKRARYEAVETGADVADAPPAVQSAVKEAEAELVSAMEADGVRCIGAGKLDAYMWPPSPEEAAWMHLDRAMRLLPHDSNTGGFFVALLRKTASLAAPGDKESAAKSTAAAQEAPATGAGKEEEDDVDLTAAPTGGAAAAPAGEAAPAAPKDGKVGGKKRGRGEVNRKGVDTTKVTYEPLAAEEFSILRRAYGLSPAFPAHRLMVRTFSDRVVHYVSEGAAALLTMPRVGTRLKLVNVGVPMFDSKMNRKPKAAAEAAAASEGEVKPEAVLEDEGDEILDDSAYCGRVRRVCTEGMRYLVPFMTRRVMAVGDATFAHLLRAGKGHFLKFPALPANFGAALQEFGPGAVVVVCDPAAAKAGALPSVAASPDATPADLDDVATTSHGLDPSTLNKELTVVVWRNPHTVNILVRKEDREAGLLRMIMGGRLAPTPEDTARFLLHDGKVSVA